jgi:glucose/arabinose dehydrogenase
VRRGFLASLASVGGCVAPTTGFSRPAEEWSGSDARTAPTDRPAALTAEPLVERLEIPWDLAVAPTGAVFVSERTGRVRRLRDGTGTTAFAPGDAIDAGVQSPGPDGKPFHETWFLEGGEGGVLGVAVHPRYPAVSRVYVYYTRETGAGKRNAVVAFDPDGDGTPRTIVGDVPAGGVHNGGRIAFGPENYLWVTTGDAGTAERARDPATLAGKVLRVTAEGVPAPGNDAPADGDPRVYTRGHRNPQGLTWLPDGTPVLTEHGPNGGDEVNLLAPGGDYGWPEARSERGYRDAPGVRRPLVHTPAERSWAPSGCEFASGAAPAGARRRLFVGCLFDQRVRALTFTPPGETPPPDGERFDAAWLDPDYDVTAHTVLEGLGRVRTVHQGPGGALYALTSNRDGRARGAFPRHRDDVLVRLRPG